MSGQHTPGPWMLGLSPILVVAPVDAENVMNIALASSQAGKLLRDPANSYAKANARLIASAPDLLAVAHESFTLVSDLLAGIGVNDDRLRNLADQVAGAIAKAETPA